MDICQRFLAGPSSQNGVGVDLSAAHAGVRFFSPIGACKDADQALAAALDPEDAFGNLDLGPYQAALPGVVCAAPAVDGDIGFGSVEVMGDVALVRPGTYTPIPPGVKAIAIDVRGYQETGPLLDAIEVLAGFAMATPVPRASARVRQHHGMTDEVFSAQNVYGNKTAVITQEDLHPFGTADLPIAFLTDAKTAPSAAAVAINLRLLNRAYIYGEDLLAAVGEMRWQGVGLTGIAYRDRVLMTGGQVWPDVIPADVRSAHPECLIADLAKAGMPPPIAAGGVARPQFHVLTPFGDTQPAAVTLGSARAALITAHGALRTFFPYFEVVGDTIDDRLTEVIAMVDTPSVDRTLAKQALERFGNAISDGHQFVFDYGATPAAGYFPVYVEEINGEPVVRRSADPGVSPGDTITSIGGVPAMQWYQTELQRTSAASDGYRFFVAGERYQRLDGPLALDLRDPDGNTKTVTVQPQPAAAYQAFGFAPVLRPAGALADLGAPDLYYINMDGAVLTDISQFDTALAAASSAKGLVIDMRGYPGIDHYEAAERLINASFKAPAFEVSTLTGYVQLMIENEGSYALSPLQNPSFAGPIVLLVGHATVSAAENFSIMLVDAQRVKVMGRRSAATDGNITGVQLPAAFGFSFTGMEVRHSDAQMSQFHAIGIVPDTETTLTAADFRDGKDPELQDAVAWLLSH